MTENNLEYKLTVLICVHSANLFYDNLLIYALRSLERQTFKLFKTLIVLDGCWNETENRIISENLQLDILIKKKENKDGLANAKNYGLSFVDTELVAFLDGDDLYVENKLEVQIDFFEKNEVDFLGTQSWYVAGHGENDELLESLFKLGTNETHEDLIKVIFGENVLTHGSMMIKMKALRELNFYEDVRGMEDWFLWRRAIGSGYKFHQIQERLYIYRMFTGQSR